jgi:hypothetical protein
LVSVAQFLVTAIISILVTMPAVRFIPRARQSPTFDRVLWVGTWGMAFLAAWFVLGNFGAALSALDILILGEVSVIPALVGAAIGAFALNGLLWSMDRFSRSPLDEDAPLEESDDGSDAPAAIAGEGTDDSV